VLWREERRRTFFRPALNLRIISNEEDRWSGENEQRCDVTRVAEDNPGQLGMSRAEHQVIAAAASQTSRAS